MLELNEKEKQKIKVIEQVINKEITQKQASLKLEISDRQVRRLVVVYNKEGKEGFIHKNRGKVSNKKVSTEIKEKIVDTYINEYADYNFTHFYEEQGMKFGISFSAMNTIFQNNEIISPLAQHKTVKVYNERMKNAIKEQTISAEQKQVFEQRQKEEIEKHIRRSTLHYSFGEEVQMDAAFWIWFSNIETALHLAVDKATKKVLYGWFSKEETTESYMILLMNIILLYGLPQKIKTDKRSSFSVNNARSSKSKLNVTQFKRICEDLDIHLVCNSNPLFKPNVERENGTFKGRLKAELNHNHITTMEEANKYLNEIFISKMNERFSYDINPDKNVMQENTYSPEELNIIISIRTKRIIDNASSIKYFSKYYLPIDDETGEVMSFTKGTGCIVVNTYDKKLLCIINNELHSLFKIEKPEPKKYEKVEYDKRHIGHKPSSNHPWKNGH
jgi:hypothetical protein